MSAMRRRAGKLRERAGGRERYGRVSWNVWVVEEGSVGVGRTAWGKAVAAEEVDEPCWSLIYIYMPTPHHA